jgi:hypothetical protein
MNVAKDASTIVHACRDTPWVELGLGFIDASFERVDAPRTNGRHVRGQLVRKRYGR